MRGGFGGALLIGFLLERVDFCAGMLVPLLLAEGFADGVGVALDGLPSFLLIGIGLFTTGFCLLGTLLELVLLFGLLESLGCIFGLLERLVCIFLRVLGFFVVFYLSQYVMFIK